MAQSIQAGDRIVLAERDVQTADAKSGLYYPHYRGLIGTVAKVYDDGTVAVTIDPQSLPEAIRKQHVAGSEAQRQKWLDGLSDEARNRLSAAEKQFSLRYTVLAANSDVQKLDRKSTDELDLAESQYLDARRGKG